MPPPLNRKRIHDHGEAAGLDEGRSIFRYLMRASISTLLSVIDEIKVLNARDSEVKELITLKISLATICTLVDGSRTSSESNISTDLLV